LQALLPNCRIIRIDFLSNQIATSRHEHNKNVEFHVMIAEELSFSYFSFDLYTNNLCLQLVENPTRMLAEA